MWVGNRRRRAGEAGAELAQRFSARVTHVVVEPGLPADDSRVAKALAADLRVLTLAECAQVGSAVEFLAERYRALSAEFSRRAAGQWTP